MDDIVTRTRPRISAAEMERRRKAVRVAAAESRLEGMKRRPESDAVFEAFIRGEIDAADIIHHLNRLPQPT